MNIWQSLFVLAQSEVAAETASPAPTPTGPELVAYRFGRLEQIDDPRWLWLGLAVAAVLLVAFVAWQYRRESAALPRWATFVLGGLRLAAFAGAIIFFLEPLKRTDQEIVTESRVAVLVDASQSMAVEDEKAGDDAGLSRSEAVLRTLEDSPLIEELRSQHDVTVAVFDADVRRIAQWKREPAATGGREPSPKKPASELTSEGEGAGDADRDQRSRLAEALKPIGAETRLGDALAAALADQAGGSLAGIYTFSDGGQNLGVDPLAVADAAAAAKSPIVTVGVGSTAPRRNLRLQELIAPSRAYPEDKVAVRALVQGEGYAGRTFDVELYAREGEGAAQVRIGQEQAVLEADGETVPVEFDIEPAAIGRLELEARIVAPPDDQYGDDNARTAEIDVVETSTKVLLIASGATRDYRFLRNQLKRDRHANVDVWLQMSPPGISQDADKVLQAFPSTKEELFDYDVIVAFDPDWTQLDAQQVDLLEQWVAEEAGGLIVVAGPVHTASWVQSPEHAKVRALYPVEFQQRMTLLDDGLYGSPTPWPIEMTREGMEADFLWLGDTPEENRARWSRFPGVFGCYAVKGPKPGAQVYGRYSDPEAGISVERPVYFADQFYGSGRVFYMGSGELWRLRTLDPGYFERLYTQLVRHVSQGRLLRGSSVGRLLVERDRYFVGDTIVVRAQLSTPNREPLVAPRVSARVTGPNNQGMNVDLIADESRPGNFVGQFTVSNEGSYRIELALPEQADEPLVKRITATVPDLEFAETRRNEELLTAIAARSGGKYYASPQLAATGDSALPPAGELIESRAETKILRGKPDAAFAEALNRALLGVICGALCAEWLLRRLLKLA
ncbi:hypothetical protein [Lacipirellula limnantheis]|uniref:VWFA domain-containing protein n=1 Tax=Lacipirellula limnantheis TaxID=2528024 RepID=A0A517TZM5_9BACT|nr:hypothetical protein [Lacipirellula limnantheis]QDT73837.1 hypothetical protein I41_30280 [Lacipirellula limnantheis]